MNLRLECQTLREFFPGWEIEYAADAHTTRYPYQATFAHGNERFSGTTAPTPRLLAMVMVNEAGPWR